MVMDGRSRRPLQRALMGVPLTRWYITSHAYIKDDAPDTNFGDPDTAIMYREVGGAQWHAIFKFEKRAVFTATDFIRHLLLIAATPLGLQHMITTAAGNLYVIKMWSITDDFDTSTITWNIYAGLSKTAATQIDGRWIRSSGNTGYSWYDGDVAGNNGFVFYRENPTNLAALAGAYGIAIEISTLTAANGDWLKLTADRVAVGSNYAGYLELF